MIKQTQEPSSQAESRSEIQIFPSNHHPLRTTWQLYYSKEKNIKQHEFLKNKQLLASISTLESFLSFYHHLKKPSLCSINTNLLLFRQSCLSSSQKYSNSGYFYLEYPKPSIQCDTFWQQLLFSSIGEIFTINMIGISLLIKQTSTILQLWIRAQQYKPQIQLKLSTIIPTDKLLYKKHVKKTQINKVVNKIFYPTKKIKK